MVYNYCIQMSVRFQKTNREFANFVFQQHYPLQDLSIFSLTKAAEYTLLVSLLSLLPYAHILSQISYLQGE